MKATIGNTIKFAFDCSPIEFTTIIGIQKCADGTEEYECDNDSLVHEDELDMDNQIVLLA